MDSIVKKQRMFPTLIILVAVVVTLLVNLSTVQGMVSQVYDFCIAQFGWFFVTVDLLCLVFALWIMFGPYKNIRLGGEACKPVFSTASWAGMMFTTSCGAWLVVYGFLEPIYCSAQAPFQLESLSEQALEYGQAYAHFHWGPNAWCIYVPISIAIGYALYNRKEKEATISIACTGIKSGTRSWNGIWLIVDIISICGVIIAPIISIGTGMPLLVAIAKRLFGLEQYSDSTIQIIVLAIWILIFGTSVYLGLNKGIKK